MSLPRRCDQLLLSLTLFGTASCSKTEHPPTYHKGEQAPIDAGLTIPIDAGSDEAPPENMTNICGSLVIPLAPSRTNLYIVLDRSGSMGPDGTLMLDPTSGRTVTKHSAALNAIVGVLFAMGHRVN